MSRLFYLTLIFLLSISIDIYAFKRDIIYLKFEQDIVSNGSMIPSGPMLPKPQRVNNQAGRIDILYEGEVPEELKIGIQAAADRWASVIKNKIPIRVIVLMEELNDNLCSQVEVGYGYLENDNTTLYPTSLLAELTGNMYSDEENPNAFIVLNPNIIWDTSFNNEIAISGVNIYSCALRSFAIAFGFGSSVISVDGGSSISYYDIRPSVFDNLIISNKQKMSSLSSLSPELRDFVTRSSIYAFREDPNYKLYSPAPFISGKSLVYFDNENSLMHYDFGTGDCRLNIDQYTLDMLNKIGWGVEQESKKNIICDDIGENGLGSAYKPHVFRLNDTIGVSNYNWSFVLYDKTGHEHIISNGSSPQFEIQSVGDDDKYKTNSNGDIIGYVICDYSINGNSTSSKFSVFLERQPIILSIENKIIHPAENYVGYYLTFDVYYQGSDTIYIELEEEYSSTLRTQIIHSPYKASVKTGNINPFDYAWVDIKAYNKYGEAIETIELEPRGNISETFDYEIANVKYDYNVTLEDGKYKIMGDFSFEVKVSNASDFAIANTNPYGNVKDFYGMRVIYEGDPGGMTEKQYSRPNTQPETFFKLLIRKSDGSFFSSPAICSTDYLRTEDKALFYSDVSQNHFSESLMINVNNSILKLYSDSGIRQVSLIDVNGAIIEQFEVNELQKYEISLADISRGFYIIRVIDINGEIYNKKIIY